MIYFTSDLHFYHDKIITHTQRPFHNAEEMEAWLLGDRNALRAAYANVADRISSKYSSYKQDSICGTWECLADMLTKVGIAKFRKKNSTAFDVGRCKSEWAEKIGSQMELRKNVSPSFQKFLYELDKRRDICFGLK